MSDQQAWDAGQHRQLKDFVYQQLRNDIIELRLPPGCSLREAELAARLKVSKTPVREAFVKLQKDKLVDIIPYKGAVVAGYDKRDLREIYEVRELLEGACARDAATSISARDLGELTRIVRESEEVLAREEYVKLAVLFDEFDSLIYAQTTNQRIADLLSNLQAHIKRIGQLTLAIPGRVDTSVKQHMEIYEAISRRDAAEAEGRMRAHVISVMNDQLATFPGVQDVNAVEGLVRASTQ